jgi:hypothetical protein
MMRATDPNPPILDEIPHEPEVVEGLAFSPGSVDKALPPARFKRERDAIDKFEIFSRFVLTLAASTIAVTSFLVQRVDQRRSADEHHRAEVEQIRAKYAAIESARRTYESQAIGPLVPLAIRGSGPQRLRALSAMLKVAPSVTEAVTAVLIQSATPRDRKSIDTIHDQASVREASSAFLDHLTIAREFLSRGYTGEACVEFVKASNGLPIIFAQGVDSVKQSAGQQSCSNPDERTVKGAEEMQEAFKKIQTP